MTTITEVVERIVSLARTGRVEGMNLYVHPGTLRYLMQCLSGPGGDVGRYPAADFLAGIRITTSVHVPEFAEHWEFPTERLVEYEKSDEDWCRYFGIGRSVKTRVFWKMPDRPVPEIVGPALSPYRMHWDIAEPPFPRKEFHHGA